MFGHREQRKLRPSPRPPECGTRRGRAVSIETGIPVGDGVKRGCSARWAIFMLLGMGTASPPLGCKSSANETTTAARPGVSAPAGTASTPPSEAADTKPIVEGPGPGHQADALPSDEAALDGRVANFDPLHAEHQPDWDQRARQLAGEVLPRMQSRPAPASIDAGCRKMLDAARELYDLVEATADAARSRRQILEASFEADLEGCRATTSVRATHCVTILLGDHNAEFPWLLDQCMRAFPKQSDGN